MWVEVGGMHGQGGQREGPLAPITLIQGLNVMFKTGEGVEASGGRGEKEKLR